MIFLTNEIDFKLLNMLGAETLPWRKIEGISTSTILKHDISENSE